MDEQVAQFVGVTGASPETARYAVANERTSRDEG